MLFRSRQLFTRRPGGGALRLLQVLAQGLLALSWGRFTDMITCFVSGAAGSGAFFFSPSNKPMIVSSFMGSFYHTLARKSNFLRGETFLRAAKLFFAALSKNLLAPTRHQILDCIPMSNL